MTAGVLVVVGFMVLPYRNPDEIPRRVITNPFGIQALHGIVEPLLGLAGFTVVVSGFLAFVSLIFRYRAADAEGRQRLR